MKPILTVTFSLQAMALSTLAAMPAAPAPQAAAPRKWEHESSDLKPSPLVHFGTLPNGMRYAWVAPKGVEDKGVSLRLHVNVGSLVEQDPEQGIAHFLEHMAFNGTKNFKAGTLVTWFQDHGVRFGRDVNASTSSTQTIYELDLPDSEGERFKKAFLWFRDVADGLLLEEKEVQAEKGVIDAEERDRNDVGLRMLRRTEQELIGGTLYPKRWPIGTKSTRSKFNAAVCKAFYKKWYRPEHFTFLLAGRLDGVDVDKLVQETFAGLVAPKEPVPARPKIGAAKIASKGFCIYDKEASGCSLYAVKVRPWQSLPDDAAHRRRDFLEGQAYGIANRRLGELTKAPDSPVAGVSFGDWNWEDVLAGRGLRIQPKPGKQMEALTLVAREFDKLLAEGPSREEVRDAFHDVNQFLAIDAAKGENIPAPAWMARLVFAAIGGYVPTEDVDARDLMKPMEKEINQQALQQVLKESWLGGELYLFCTGNVDLGADADKQLRAAWEGGAGVAKSEAVAAEAEAPDSAGESSTTGSGAFAYGAKGAMGEITQEGEVADLSLVQITFDNGVRATIHEGTAKGGGALVVRIGEGYLALDPTESDVGWVADQIFLSGGLGKHDLEELKKTLSGSSLQFAFNMHFDACVFSGAAAGQDFQRLCEVICAYITDPGWRQDAFDRFNQGLPRFYESMEKGFRGPSARFDLQLHAGDGRFGIPDRKEVESFLLDTVKEFLQPQLDEGPIEIGVVAGIPVDAVKKALARTFGLLPERRARIAYDDHLKAAPVKGGLKFKQEIETDDKKALLRVVFPTTDGIDPRTRRRLYFLQEVLDDRLRVEIREKKGAAYSPDASSSPSTLFPGVGSMEIQVTVDPAKVDEVTNACLATTDLLAKSGVKPEEVERVRGLVKPNLEKRLEDDGFWLGYVAEALSNPKGLDELRSVRKWYDDITADEVSALAKQFLVRKNASVCVITPKKGAAKKK